MIELVPGLWRWTAPHPLWRPEMEGPGGWAQEVASVAYATDDQLVLVDPLIEDWEAIDALAEGRRVAVMLTAPWHRRSSAEVAERYGAGVLTERPGVESFPVGHEGEVLLWLPAVRALISAEALTGSDEGLRVAVSPEMRSRAELDAVLETAAALDPQLVLPGHGPPVLSDGAAEIRAALLRPPW